MDELLNFESLLGTVNIQTVLVMAVVIIAVLQALKVLGSLLGEFLGLEAYNQCKQLIPVVALALGVFLAWITAVESITNQEIIQHGVVYGVAAIGAYETFVAKAQTLMKNTMQSQDKSIQ